MPLIVFMHSTHLPLALFAEDEGLWEDQRRMCVAVHSTANSKCSGQRASGHRMSQLNSCNRILFSGIRVSQSRYSRSC
jgi:hypothetical protein